jgi:hypothetical protein
MHAITLTMERVFDVVCERDRHYVKYTTFSFEHAGRKHYGIHVLGWQPVESGMTVSAILAKPDDWHTLLGWVNLASGEITPQENENPGMMLAVGITIFFLVLMSGNPWPLLIALPVSFFGVLGLRRNMRLRRALEALAPPSNG